MKPLLRKSNTKNMIECIYCDKPLECGTNNGKVHNGCINESCIRIGNQLCQFCGKTQDVYNGVKCQSCTSSNALPQGYPGP